MGALAVAFGYSHYWLARLPGEELKIREGGTLFDRASRQGELHLAAKLVVWDESVMADRAHLEAYDATMRDVEDSATPFGGRVIVVLAGDFRQLLPVVRRPARPDYVARCLRSSPLWLDGTIQIRRLSLTSKTPCKIVTG